GIVARGEFDHRVEVTSDDEFGDLTASFNQMASDLGRHVRTLEAGHAIDRAVLSARRRTEIVNAVLRQAPELLPGDSVGLALAANARDRWSWTVSALDPHGNLVENLIEVTEGERTALERSPEGVAIDLEADPHGRSYLALEVLCQERSIARAFPLVHGGWLQGAVILSFRDRSTMAHGELHRVNQLADRIAVAVSNARLVEDLDQMHQGTLTTLARAIDAKSPWTAGHSERVTDLAVALGQRLGLDAESLTLLYRGGLLHDVGKIGVPAEVIDKPSALTEAEREVMESHTRIGTRILAPIAAYHDIMDIVRHHHERWDGMGYPDQLSGEEIPLLARVMALADVYDALTSARPYRAGWEHEYALDAIRRGGGSAFDPTLTQEFVSLMADGWTPRAPRNA
ncbi:MAG: HD domain-containing phosphohydrolase, partial [Gemmatimonadota bacterium]